MLRNFAKLAVYPDCTDEQMRTFFYLLPASDADAALALLQQHRPKLARQIARELLEAMAEDEGLLASATAD